MQILSYLLPDLSIIECDMDWSPMCNDPPRHHSPQDWFPLEEKAVYKFRSDDEPCYSDILCTSKQLYEDGRTFLYSCKTYKLTVFDFGFDFLTRSNQLPSLPPLPYGEIKEFVITVSGCNLTETGYRLREKLVWLCGLFRRHHAYFQKLKIVFLGDCWIDAWDQTGIEDPERPQEGDNVFQLPNVHIEAWEKGFSSIFAWMITPLALVPTAGRCIIEIPPTLQEKRHILDLIMWYEDGINGTYEFPNIWYLQEDQAQFEWMWDHPHESNRNCKCEDYFHPTFSLNLINGEDLRRTRDPLYVCCCNQSSGFINLNSTL